MVDESALFFSAICCLSSRRFRYRQALLLVCVFVFPVWDRFNALHLCFGSVFGPHADEGLAVCLCSSDISSLMKSARPPPPPPPLRLPPSSHQLLFPTPLCLPPAHLWSILLWSLFPIFPLTLLLLLLFLLFHIYCLSTSYTHIFPVSFSCLPSFQPSLRNLVKSYNLCKCWGDIS